MKFLLPLTALFLPSLLFCSVGLATSGFDSPDCKSFRSQLSNDYVQGQLSTAENWLVPEGRKIQIFYYYKPVANKKPFLFINGGPAQDSHAQPPNFSIPNSAWNNEVVVFMDQRGTGCSDPYPEVSESDWFNRMSLYGSDGIIADAEAIRSEVFHLNNWNVYGHSFGGFTLYKYIIQHPTSIDKAVVFGASVYDDPIQMPVERLRFQNSNAQLLFREFPKAYENWKILRSKTTSAQCIRFSDLNGCGPSILDAQFLRMFRTYKMGDLAQILLHDVLDESGQVAWTPAAVNGLIAGQGFSFVTDRKPAMYISLMENGMNLFTSTDYRVAEARLKSEGEDPGLYPISERRFLELYDDPEFDAELRKVVRVTKPHILDLVRALRNNPNLKLYVFNGKFDGSVPTPLYRDIKLISKWPLNLLKFTYLPFSGHEYQTNPEVEQLVLGDAK